VYPHAHAAEGCKRGIGDAHSQLVDGRRTRELDHVHLAGRKREGLRGQQRRLDACRGVEHAAQLAQRMIALGQALACGWRGRIGVEHRVDLVRMRGHLAELVQCDDQLALERQGIIPGQALHDDYK
jgi:hypothetical protein